MLKNTTSALTDFIVKWDSAHAPSLHKKEQETVDAGQGEALWREEGWHRLRTHVVLPFKGAYHESLHFV